MLPWQQSLVYVFKYQSYCVCEGAISRNGSLPLSVFSFCACVSPLCLHWPLCHWQIVMSVCTMSGSALSFPKTTHWKKGNRRGRDACTCQDEAKRKWERHTRRVKAKEKKFWSKNEMGEWGHSCSLSREFQGCYMKVSQQQDSSAAYNTHVVSSSWYLILTPQSQQANKFLEQNTQKHNTHFYLFACSVLFTKQDS